MSGISFPQPSTSSSLLSVPAGCVPEIVNDGISVDDRIILDTPLQSAPVVQWRRVYSREQGFNFVNLRTGDTCGVLPKDTMYEMHF